MLLKQGWRRLDLKQVWEQQSLIHVQPLSGAQQPLLIQEVGLLQDHLRQQQQQPLIHVQPLSGAQQPLLKVGLQQQPLLIQGVGVGQQPLIHVQPLSGAQQPLLIQGLGLLQQPSLWHVQKHGPQVEVAVPRRLLRQPVQGVARQLSLWHVQKHGAQVALQQPLLM